MKLETFGISDLGLVRQNNEDVWAEVPGAQFYVLADGMGGHKAGEVAAKVAVIKLCQAVNDLPEHFSLEQLADYLKKAIQETNAYVYRLSHQSQDLNGMGTTLCCFLIHGRTLIYAHVGDSRIYRFRNTIERLTQDHSLRHELIARGELSEAESFPFKNVITRAVGTSSSVLPEVATTEIQQGDIYFLCSDGLNDPVSDPEIEAIIRSAPSVKAACETLVVAANAKGGKDNITIVMAKIT